MPPSPNWVVTPGFVTGLSRHKLRDRVELDSTAKPKSKPKPKPKPTPPPSNSNSNDIPFDTTFPSNFDIGIAVELMGLCMNSYEQLIYYKANNGSLNGWSIKVDDNSIYEILDIIYSYEKQPSKDLDIVTELPMGFIAKKENPSPLPPDYYVCFRGTETAIEWEDNANFKKTKCVFLTGNEQVHKGFQKIYTSGGIVPSEKSPRDRILDLLKTLNPAEYRRLFVTGHSLGAAQAVLSVTDIVSNTVHKSAIMYNFAGPAVGDSAFATTYKNIIGTDFCNGKTGTNLCSWRVVNIYDKVPDLPPSSDGYVHVNGCSGQSVCNNVDRNDNKLNGVYQILFGDKGNFVEAHHATLYLSKLQDLQNQK